MWRSTHLTCLALLVGLPLAQPLAAETRPGPQRPACHSYIEIARQLDSRYGEKPVSIGLQGNGHLLQVFASKDTGSWTILSMAPNGIACIVAAGRSWEAMPLPSSDPEA
jgi:hypothetical protein